MHSSHPSLPSSPLFKRSSLLNDEAWANLNALVLKQLPLLENINYLEINNVCDGGLELMAALRERVKGREKK